MREDVTISLPSELHALGTAIAQKMGVTLSRFLEELIVHDLASGGDLRIIPIERRRTS